MSAVVQLFHNPRAGSYSPRAIDRLASAFRNEGADVILSNHTAFDGSQTKLPAMATRRPGDPHPYVIGADAVGRYLTVAEECALAGRARVH